ASRADRTLHSFPTRRSSDLHAALEEAVAQPVQRQTGDAKHGNAADRLELEPGDQDLEIGGNDLELDEVSLAQVGEGRHLARRGRSEEHTSELQSRENLVCRL